MVTDGPALPPDEACGAGSSPAASAAELLALAPVAVAHFDSTGRVTAAAGGGYALLGIRPEDTVGVMLLAPSTATSRIAAAVTSALSGVASSFRMKLGPRWFSCTASPVEGGGLLVAVEATEQLQAGDRLERLVASAPVCIAAFDPVGRIVHASGEGYAAIGVRPEETIGHSMFDLYGDSTVISDSLYRCLAGEDIHVVTDYRGRVWELHYRAVIGPDGTQTGGLCTAQDMTGWISDRSALIPVHTGPDPKIDPLTGVLSRHATAELLSVPLAGEQAAVALVDMDAFALLNDTHGHAAGDIALLAVAERLRAVVGSQWEVGRWSADCFAVVRRADAAPGDLPALLERVTAAMTEPVDIGVPVHLSVSMGAASTLMCSFAQLFDAASADLGRAKRRRDGTRPAEVEGSPSMAAQSATSVAAQSSTSVTSSAAEVPSHATLVSRLQDAMDADQIGLHYQPVVRLSDRRAVGVEALARWLHPTEGVLPPSTFVPLAEQTGLIVPLGERLLRTACHTAATWEREMPGGLGLQLAVNLSAHQLTHPGLVALVRDALHVSGCSAGSLAVEVTETALLSDVEVAVSNLTALKDLGVGIALDDFGTGYSSMVYLRRFPVDTIKIDGSFIAGLGTDRDDSAIVASLVSLAHSVGVRCIAEGVETAAQSGLLQSMGCDLAQGHLFARATDLAGATAWLERQGGRAPSSRGAHRDGVPATTVERIFALHREGASLHTIAARLNMEGHRTSKGSLWRHNTVATVIARRAYPKAT